MSDGMKPTLQKSTPMEAECKYRVHDRAAVEKHLVAIGAQFVVRETHCDTYLRHPSRDFRATDEALRIREVNGSPMVTYKGPRLAGPIKIRPEIEIPLVPETAEQWLQIWQNLGFVIALRVAKVRTVYSVVRDDRPLTVTLDTVDGLGEFAEIERILRDSSEVELAQQDIQDLAKAISLTEKESRSYLGMLLQLQSIA